LLLARVAVEYKWVLVLVELVAQVATGTLHLKLFFHLSQ
jgi:hypothetical protein